MGELPVRRRISLEVPGAGSPELCMALAGLREIVEASGGHVFDRLVMRGIDLLHDDDLRSVAACIEPMRFAGLLAPDKQIKDLVIGTEYPQRLWDATGYKGLNKAVLSDLAHTVDHGEKIETVPRLLTMTYFGQRNIGDKKQALLRRALIDSGMPEEFPWPLRRVAGGDVALLRCLALLAPTFDELPAITKNDLARMFGIRSAGNTELTEDQLERCTAIYAERRNEVLAIAGWKG